MMSDSDLLRSQFPTQRGATTAKSGADRYVLDTWMTEAGAPKVALGSTQSSRITVCRAKDVTLLPRFVSQTKTWYDLSESPRFDAYRTGCELSDLIWERNKDDLGYLIAEARQAAENGEVHESLARLLVQLASSLEATR